MQEKNDFDELSVNEYLVITESCKAMCYKDKCENKQFKCERIIRNVRIF